jgi:hypothetical protein
VLGVQVGSTENWIELPAISRYHRPQLLGGDLHMADLSPVFPRVVASPGSSCRTCKVRRIKVRESQPVTDSK